MAPAALAPFRHRDYALLWVAGFVSNIGSWLQTVAVGALVIAETGKASWGGLVAVSAFLPLGVLGPLGGALADRLPRKACIIGFTLGETGAAAVLAWLAATGRASPAAATLAVFAGGCVAAMRLPFHQALLPDLVGRDDLLAAAALNSAQYNLGRVVGPAVAGIVVGLGGFSWAFTLNAVSFLAVVAAVAVIHVPPPAGNRDERLLAGIRAGARVIRDEPGCRAAVVLVSIVAFTVAPFIGLISARAYLLTDGTKQATARATGALTSAQGVGAVFGALLVASMAARFGRRRVLVAELIASPIALIAYALVPSLLLAVVALAVVGAVYIGLLSGLQTVVQLRAPLEYRGRALSLYIVGLGVIYPLGVLVQGPIADRIGLGVTESVFAVGLLVALGVIAVTRPALLHALDDTRVVPVQPVGATIPSGPA